MKVLEKLALYRKYLLTGVVVIGIASFGIIYAVTSSANGAKSQTDCTDTCIVLRGDEASPKTVRIPVGGYVQFRSADSKSHDLHPGKGGEEHEHHGKSYTGVFKADESRKVQFNEEGSFYLHDHFNPSISMLIVVHAPDKN